MQDGCATATRCSPPTVPLACGSAPRIPEVLGLRRRGNRLATETKGRATVDQVIAAMTCQDDHGADAIASSITVRAAAGQLKVIPGVASAWTACVPGEADPRSLPSKNIISMR